MNFEERWLEKKRSSDLEQSRQHWDNRAHEFNEIGKKRVGADPIIKLLKDKGAIFPGARVLDIGCGAGRYAKQFLEIGCEVTGIDISPNMIQFTRENTEDLNSGQFEFRVLSWESIDLAAEGWEDYFDLVFASMSPAISGPEELKKMVRASRDYCFMSSHIIKKDQLGDELKTIMKIENKNPGYRTTLYYAFNMLWEMGFFPEFGHTEFRREQVWEVEKAMHYYSQILGVTDAGTKQSLRDHLIKRSADGQIQDLNYSKNGQLLWSIA